MLRLGLVGHPVAHSRSPTIQGVFAQSSMIPVKYDLFDVPPEGLSTWLARSAPALDGFNVTAPHKEAVWAAVGALGPEARRLKAVNTVRQVGEHWEGHNTDLAGFLALLGDRTPTHTLVLGAGGAARAVVAGLADRGLALSVAARRPAQAEALLAELAVAAEVVPLGAVAERLSRTALVVDCVGAPGVVSLPWDRLPPGSEVLTLAYGASTAPLRAAVEATGHALTDGLLMLVEQARAAFALWTGWPVPDPVARAALEAARDV